MSGDVSDERIASALFAACFMPVSCLDYSLTLKMEVIYSCETSVDFKRTAQRYNPEDINLKYEHSL
jgi:hypothetical protein